MLRGPRSPPSTAGGGGYGRAEGHTNAEISRRLYLSLRTVEAHRGQLRTKLGLHTRAELSSYAREHGLVR